MIDCSFSSSPVGSRAEGLGRGTLVEDAAAVAELAGEPPFSGLAAYELVQPPGVAMACHDLAEWAEDIAGDDHRLGDEVGPWVHGVEVHRDLAGGDSVLGDSSSAQVGFGKE